MLEHLGMLYGRIIDIEVDEGRAHVWQKPGEIGYDYEVVFRVIKRVGRSIMPCQKVIICGGVGGTAT